MYIYISYIHTYMYMLSLFPLLRGDVSIAIGLLSSATGLLLVGLYTGRNKLAETTFRLLDLPWHCIRIRRQQARILPFLPLESSFLRLSHQQLYSVHIAKPTVGCSERGKDSGIWDNAALLHQDCYHHRQFDSLSYHQHKNRLGVWVL